MDGGANARGLRRQDIARWVLFHEYVHYVMALGGALVPSWYAEGLAEYMATTEFREDGSYTLGCPPLVRTRTMPYLQWVHLSRLMEAPVVAELMDDRHDTYLQSWLLVHYLSADRARATQLSRYLQLHAKQVEHTEAIRDAFGVEPEALNRVLRDYAQKQRFDCAAITPATPLAVPRVEARPIARAEASLHVGSLLLATLGPNEQAFKLLHGARRQLGKTDARAAIELARAHFFQALDSKDPAALEPAYSLLEQARAVAPDDPELQVVEAHVLSQQAALTMDTQPDQARALLDRARRAYRRAIRSDEMLAEAYAGLGRTYVFHDNGSKEAVVVLETAAALLPSYVEIPIWLAQIQIGRGNHEAAIAPLRYAMVHTDSKELQQAAAAALTELLFQKERKQPTTEQAD